MKKVLKCGMLFTSVDESVQKDMAVVIENNKITEVLPLAQADLSDAEVIDLSDKFVMPGLIDSHMHTMLTGNPTIGHIFIDNTVADLTIECIVNMQKDLMAGFTTIRDEGGYGFGEVAVKNAVNSGKLAGPRMFVSGLCITATGGHADSHYNPSIKGDAQLGYVVDSPDDVRKAARYNFKYGADQLKIMATGGVLSFGDDPKCSEFTFEEMKAAIDIAKSRGKITSAHAHGSDGIKIAVKAGITSIEHGMLMDDECIDLMAEHGTYLVPTIIAAYKIVKLGEEGGLPEWLLEKAKLVLSNHKNNLEKCRKAGIKIAFGSDAGTSYNFHGEQAYEFELMCDFGFTPQETLIAATRTNAQMMQLNDLGTVESGKLADIVAFDKNPIEDIKTMTNVSFVMKDGNIYKKDGKQTINVAAFK